MLANAIKMLMKEYDPVDGQSAKASADTLRRLVEKYSFLRNYNANPDGNRQARLMLVEDFFKHCPYVCPMGKYGNVVAEWKGLNKPKILITGHYDSPLGSPGADDNASALAVMLHTAELIKHCKIPEVMESVRFVAFNREEDGLLGSIDFTKEFGKEFVDHVINLEMVGYYTPARHSQKMPEGFPPIDVGNFLAVVGNRDSGTILKDLIKAGKSIHTNLPIKGINIPLGIERKIPGLSHLSRSDHAPFWWKRIPAVMLTDTSEFRNANYHKPSDTPDTLDYHKMASVVDLLCEYVFKKVAVCV